MLKSLSISNFILIDYLDIDFSDGFNVITGETGAGKSIILSALAMACGNRVGLSNIKDDKKNAVVIASFDLNNQVVSILEDQGIEYSEDLIIRRIIMPNGKTKAFVNDNQVSLKLLNMLSQCLIEVCGQHDTHSLLNKKNHITMLDQYANCLNLTKEVSGLYSEYKQIKGELDTINQKALKSDVEISYWEHVINEIESFEIEENEEDKLIEKRVFLKQKQKLLDAVDNTQSEFSGNNNIANKIHKIQKYFAVSDVFESASSALDAVLIELEEVENTVNDMGYELRKDDNGLEQLEDRLFALRNLARKYNTEINQLNDFLLEANKQLEFFSNVVQQQNLYEQKLNDIKEKFIKKAKQLSDLRQVAAINLRKGILLHLSELKMESADIQINCIETEEWSMHGINTIAFLVRTNNGQKFSDIEQAASGGELSRFMLAFKLALSVIKSVSINIFDEIDTGIGGAVSHSVGKKLQELATSKQVIVVSHQPQVVVHAQHHYLISKQNTDKGVNVNLSLLTAQQKESEVARMISGKDISNESLKAAKTLIKSAK